MGQSLLSRAVSLMQGISEVDLRGLQLGWSRRSFLSILTNYRSLQHFPCYFILFSQNTALEQVERHAFLTLVLLCDGPGLCCSLFIHTQGGIMQMFHMQKENNQTDLPCLSTFYKCPTISFLLDSIFFIYSVFRYYEERFA